jgi:hypothetical protein
MPSTNPPPPVRTALRFEALEDRVTPVAVRFDYSFDTSGFFANSDRRAALNRVAEAITARMTDSLAAVTPSAGNTWTARVYDPASSQYRSFPGLTVGANEVVVYITAGNLGGALGIASGGAYSASGQQPWLDTIRHRGQTGADAAADYATWGGLIAFNTATNWDFSAGAPAPTQFDFDSIATHEMLHLFGFGLENPSFTRLVSGGHFNGPNAVAVYGGSVPMQPGEGSDHFAAGTRYAGQESVMTAAIAAGAVKRMTELEYAVLKDVGWGSNGSAAAPPASASAPPAPVLTPSPVVSPSTRGGLNRFAVGNGVGATAGVNAYSAAGQSVFSGTVLPTAFTGGQRVASGDVTGDGVTDYAVGAGPGGAPAVTVVDGRTGQTVFSFLPFEEFFRGGVYVAVGDVNRDGKADLAVGAGEGGGPRVKLYDGATGGQLADFWGIEDLAFRGGVRVALGDVNADGAADLVAAAGEGGGPRVAVYDGRAVRGYATPTRLLWDFLAFEKELRNGSYVAVADLNGDGYGDVIAGAGEGGAPRVTVFNGRSLLAGNTTDWVANYFVGDPGTVSGVRVAATDVNGDGRDDLITAPGPNTDGLVRVFSGLSAGKLGTAPAPFLALSRPEWAAYGAFVG